MATPPLSTKITMDGEKEYKQALSEINSGLKVLGSEMKLATAQFADNADSVEALTAKGDILERQMLTQKEKVETLREALQSAATAYGESDKKTNDWKVSLNNAEAQLANMERELDANRQALQDVTDSADDAGDGLEDVGEKADDTGNDVGSLGDVVEELAGKLGISLPDGAKDAIDSLGEIDGKTAAVVGGFAAVVAAVVEVEKALIDMTVEAASDATELSHLADTLNMDVEAAQKWDYVLQSVGSSLEEAQGDLSAFQEKIMEAATGEGEAAEMFALLDVAVQDQSGTLRSADEVLLDTIAALQQMDDITQRNAVSSTLLGGTGEKLIPIYEKEAGAVEALMEKKEELGVLTEEEIDVLSDVSQSLMDYEQKTKSAKNTIAVEFAPALSAFYEAAGDGVLGLGEDAADSGLVGFFASVLDLVTSLSPVMDILGGVLLALEVPLDVLSVGLGVVADMLALVTNGLAAVINLLKGDFTAALENASTITNIFSGNGNTATSFNRAFNASGDFNFAGGLTWVGENGPELAYLPQGSRIYSNQESRQMGGDTFYVTIDAKNVKEFNDIVTIAQSQRRYTRMEEQ